MPLRYGSLFSGVGGMDIGLDRAGLECSFQVEIDPFCRQILTKHWPNVPKYENIKNCYGTVDLDRSVKTSHPELGWDARMAGKLRKLTEEQAGQCAVLYERGLSAGTIADYFSVSRQAMWDLLHRRVKMRSKLRYGSENHFHRGGKTASDRAQNLLETAVSQGIIQRKVVGEQCKTAPVFKDGRTGIQAHHPDYNKPLEVMWLCQKCHRKRDQELGKARIARIWKCVFCGKLTNRRCKTCSLECLSMLGRLNAMKRWEGHAQTKRCAFCGKAFQYDRARQTTCSQSCGNRMAWKNRSAELCPTEPSGSDGSGTP